MIRYFRESAAGGELPTFSGAAELLGADTAAIGEQKNRDPGFARAVAECRAILSDHLIRQGLVKRYDASLVKYLLPLFGVGGGEDESGADELAVNDNPIVDVNRQDEVIERKKIVDKWSESMGFDTVDISTIYNNSHNSSR